MKKRHRKITIPATVVVALIGLYYSFLFAPGRQSYENLAVNLVFIRSALQDEVGICEKDPQLKKSESKSEMNKLQDQLADYLNKINAASAYNWTLWGRSRLESIDEFTKFGWDQYFYIKENKKCPDTMKSAKDLYKWENEIVSRFPRYWFI